MDLERYRWLLAAAFSIPLLVGIGFLLHDRLSGPQPLQLNMGDVPLGEVRVYVAGAVQRPGVYPLAEGDRWLDALEAAGGPTADADLTAVNLARRAQDEDQITVPRQGEVAVSGVSREPLVDLNTASETELEALPGIGETRAAAIVRSRDTQGAFASPEDLLSRDLVSQSVFDQIAPLITAGPVQSATPGP